MRKAMKDNKNTKKEQYYQQTNTAPITTSYNTSTFINNIVLNSPNAFIHELIRKKAL